ncbi:MAG: SDR family oxidoreductase [Flavobacteriaceae bacterium]|nr:SDR family oxidoreductase [Bacteroidia bacterium]MBT8286691.1 SDR family oxidoreductase [Bacteroidia bacterium]NNF74742.1 SDR family oxidoreductase [Flavobacteriaceae bacterium]NNK73003.1 SDR family oxidoreductase [Flavobacteriaceae bacterium]
MERIVLVTGGSSGIGKSICHYLSQKDFKVYGTSRNPENYSDSPIELLPLDVTDNTSIRHCVEMLYSREGRIDILINNAGAGITGAVEEVPESEIRKNFETNFMGPVNMMKAILPLMRQNNNGLIINITSIAGFMGLPYRGVYCASKASLEIIVEAMRMEVKDFGISITNLAPGDFATNIAAGRYHAPANDKSPYAEQYSRILKMIDEDVDQADDPKAVARAVYAIINKDKPKAHYKVGTFLQRFSVILKAILPQKLFESMMIRHHKM